MFEYRGVVTGLHDGDTFTADIDLGFRLWMHGWSVRLEGLNAPELGKTSAPIAAGQASTLAVARALGIDVVALRRSRPVFGNFGDYTIPVELRPRVALRSTVFEKYGRVLAYVWVGDVCGADEDSVNAGLLAGGFAVPMDG